MDFICPHCSTACEGRPEVVGSEVRCPSCRKTFIAQIPRKHLRTQWGVVTACCVLVLMTAGVVFWLFSDYGSNYVRPAERPIQQSAERIDPEQALVPETNETPDDDHTSPQELLKRCVTITTVDSHASGFFFKRKGRVFVVTCNHVVFDQPFLLIHDLNGKEYPATKVYCAKDRDMALVALKDATNLHVPSFEIEEDVGSIEIESDLVCYGDSEGKGVIVRSEGKLLGIGPRVIETDTTIVPGNSGGPILLASNGKVVGIASHLTINSGTWVKGTRFDNQTRRFAVRMDNVNWEELFDDGISVLQPTDYHAIYQFAQDVFKGENGHTADSVHSFYCAFWAASHGDSEAQTVVGLYYEFGTGVGKDIATAIKWYQKAVDQQEPKAQRILGLKYLKGSFLPIDKRKAYELFESATKGGDLDAEYRLGMLSAPGSGIIDDWSVAFRHLENAASRGHVLAMTDLGQWYEIGVNGTSSTEKALFWYDKAAENGDSSALYKKGLLLSRQPKPSNSIAFACFKQAADNDNFLIEECRPDCYFQIGFAYYSGSGTASVPALAFSWFERAAKLGHTRAQFYLGDCYKFGDGVSIDESKALSWYMEAAKGGDANAQYNVGQAYDSGKGVPVDKEEAVCWYMRSAEQGNDDAQLMLGLCFSRGEGIQKNAVEAVKWFRKSAEQGNLTAMTNLGVAFYFGNGTPKNLEQSRHWLKKALEQGSSQAADFLQKHPEILRPKTVNPW